MNRKINKKVFEKVYEMLEMYITETASGKAVASFIFWTMKNGLARDVIRVMEDEDNVLDFQEIYDRYRNEVTECVLMRDAISEVYELIQVAGISADYIIMQAKKLIEEK